MHWSTYLCSNVRFFLLFLNSLVITSHTSCWSEEQSSISNVVVCCQRWRCISAYSPSCDRARKQRRSKLLCLSLHLFYRQCHDIFILQNSQSCSLTSDPTRT